MENVTMMLAEFISRLRYEDISGKALEQTKSCLLDSLGCALFGSSTGWGKAVKEFVRKQQGVEESALWTTDFMGPMSTVVLGNGTMVHSYDFDDYHMTKIHPGAVVMPAAVACGENEHCDGKSLLTAIVAGYETMIHIARGINPAASRLKGWHLTGTCGTFAAAAAVGNMWGFDPQTMASALGMAGTQSAGLWAFTADGSFSKRFHAGRSAQSGVIAASLARLGYCGPTKILEADDGGFFKATSEDFEFFKVIDGLGVKYDVEDVIIKPYPICGSLHSSIDAVLALKKENDIVVSEIEEIIVYNSEVVNLQCGFNYKPAGILQAQMSMKYCVARAVTDGLFTVSQLTEEKVSDPFVVDLAGRVTFVRDDEINKIYPLEFPSIVEIIMKNGKRLKKKIDSPTGSKENPLSWEAVQEKFKIHAPPVIGMNKSEKLIQVIDNLEDVNDVAVLSALMK